MSPAPSTRFGIRREVLTGMAVLAILVGVVIFIYGGVLFRTFGPEGQTVKAVFRDTNELNPKRAEVRIDGIKVGKVKDIKVDEGGRTATVEMEVFDEGFPLYKDATAHVRWRNLLGGTTVLVLDRGTPGAGELEPRVIPVSRTDNQVELDPLISVFRNGARTGFQSMLAEVPRVLRDDDTLSNAFRTLGDVAPSVGRAAGALRGERDGDLRALIKNTSEAARALDVPDEVRGLIQGGAQTLEVTARRQADVQATISRMAAVEPRVVETLDRLDSTLTVADPVIGRLRGAVGDVAPTIAQLRPVLTNADRLLDDARPLLRALRPAATSLASAARVGLPFLREITPIIERVDKTILPGTGDRKDPVTGLTTATSIGPMLASFNALAAHHDHRGYYVRFPASGGEKFPAGTGCSANFTDPEAKAYLVCQSLATSMRNFFTYRPPTPPPPGGKR